MLLCIIIRLFYVLAPMIAHNIDVIHQRIQAACVRAGRDPSEVTLICVSKGRDVGEMREVLNAGVRDIGENKVQEARGKYAVFCPGAEQVSLRAAGTASCPLRFVWHLIGHLQTNKARDAVRMFDCIHSVDSLHLAAEIDKQARNAGKVQDILVEVNTSGEESKYGIPPEGLAALMRGIALLAHVRVRGLMCMAPFSDDPASARPYFRALRETRDRVNAMRIGPGLQELSMGMSGDFETAVEEGATMVRIGRAIFEGI